MKAKYIRADSAKKKLREYLRLETALGLAAIDDVRACDVVPRKVTGNMRGQQTKQSQNRQQA